MLFLISNGSKKMKFIEVKNAVKNYSVISAAIPSSSKAFFFSKVNTNAGKTKRLANIANNKVQEISPPRAIVPLKLERVKMAKPKTKTIDV